MKPNRITFTVNAYDKDGDVTEEGIYLHMGKVSLWVGTTPADVRAIAKQLEDIASEIEDPEAFHASRPAA